MDEAAKDCAASSIAGEGRASAEQQRGQQQQQDEAAKNRTVFVTVGTSKFEALIRAVDRPEFAAALAAKDYTRLIIQKGAGKYVPCQLVPAGTTAAQHASGVWVEYFDFCPSLAAYMSSAALVISHAGAGSVFEALLAQKLLIVVANPLMMDNHQAELADHLASMQVVISTSPEGLLSAVASLGSTQLKPFPAKAACGIAELLDQLMGGSAAAGDECV
ncbi:hypothetical protein OEZ85_000073 [Tetradesmus obliquus]|uniref:Glycosyl transferase family 28 C-terminal domain-containing protein n=1 Tax=Tetradesmus obliquus TaxID=3088 RepID=A0ABY8UPE3_TETOB|nr:hypothetical protein OEZ85_000073 [Tetradesmus obliquus]